jgi:SnoaL-like protein
MTERADVGAPSSMLPRRCGGCRRVAPPRHPRRRHGVPRKGTRERWPGSVWREFVHRYLSQGRGRAYVPSNRSVAIAPDGETAWFDETLDNDHFGACRGSGVFRRENGGWPIAQYNLTIRVPDELALEHAARIRDMRPA